MFCNNEYISLLGGLVQNHKMITLLITNHCNVHCEHCIEDCGPNFSDDMPEKYVEKVISEAAGHGYLFSFQGGEPASRWDNLKKYVNMAKKAKLYTSVVTNGSWGKYPDLIKDFKEHIAPTYMVISTDHWHQKCVPIEIIDKLTDELKDHPTQIIYSSVYYKGHPEFEYVQKKNPSGMDMDLYLNKVGRGKNINVDPFKKVPEHSAMCMATGARICWDGTITACCPNESKSCQLGHVTTHNIHEILSNATRPSKMITYEHLSQWCLENKPLGICKQ
jgi:organic radical activating enzyme